MPIPLRLLIAVWLCLLALSARAAAPLVLDDGQARIDAWPAVTLLSDPTQALPVDEVLRRSAQFAPPSAPHANLGPRSDAVWLRLPLQVPAAGRWVMEIDYPPLNRVDVHLLRGGELQPPQRLGSDQPFGQRPMPTRAHALTLDLPAGRHELLLRVHSNSTLVLPIGFYRPDRFLVHETQRQLLQGLLLGLALMLLAQSLANLVSLRQPVFGCYGLMLLGTTVFFASYTGIGQQHLWHEPHGLLGLLAPLSVLLGLAGGSLFAREALDMPRHHPRLAAGLKLVAALAVAAFAATVAGLLDYRQAQTVATLLGPSPLLLAVRSAMTQARAGDASARMMLFGWGAYLVGALAMAALLRGWLPATFWTQHLFQFATLLEMLAWMRVLSLRVEGVQRQAERVELEHQTLLSLAQTDPLTGLPNRRGLSQAMAAALQQCRPDQALAVYLLDLDGFKPINDRLGHDVGDALLVQVAQRLRGLVRSGDRVARLGGDEFVVVSAGMRSEADAQALGRKLLDAFRQPFDVDGQRCSVGLTIGFALAPQDGRDAAALLKCADAAMYAGKQAGRHCIRRGAAVPRCRRRPAAECRRGASAQADAAPAALRGQRLQARLAMGDDGFVHLLQQRQVVHRIAVEHRVPAPQRLAARRRPGLQPRHLAVAHVGPAQRAAGEAAVGADLAFGADQVVDAQRRGRGLGDEAVGGRAQQQLVALAPVLVQQRARADVQLRQHAGLHEALAQRLPLRRAAAGQGADVEVAEVLHRHRAGAVVALHLRVARREARAVEHAFVDQEAAPELVAVAVQQRVVEVEDRQRGRHHAGAFRCQALGRVKVWMPWRDSVRPMPESPQPDQGRRGLTRSQQFQ